MIPTSGIAYLDTGCFIYTVEPHPVYAPLLRPIWQALTTGALTVVTSELTLMEVLVGAYGASDTVLEADYRRTLGNPLIGLLPIDQGVLGEAARLRAARLALRTPDAIHIATAILAGSASFVTNDKSLRASFSNVIVLDDLR